MNLEHKKRVVSALVGVATLCGTYFGLGHPGLVLIVVAASSAAYYELLVFSGAAEGNGRWAPLAAGAALSLWLSAGFPGPLVAVYLAALAVLLRSLWRAHRGGGEALAKEVRAAQSRVFGLTYLVIFPSFVPAVDALPHGPALLFLLLGLIWLGDIGAYYGGKAFGRHKLSPDISPGKTWEGALAGLLACAIWAQAWGSYALAHLPSWKWIGIALLTSIVAQAGDLLESLLKRAYGVKDSGTLIPGHGGVFDRFDSLILATPFFYWLLQIAT